MKTIHVTSNTNPHRCPICASTKSELTDGDTDPERVSFTFYCGKCEKHYYIDYKPHKITWE